jgi:hypothetical protein
MPDAEARRQRAAYRRGLARATALAAVVVTAMAGLVVAAVTQAGRARAATRAARQQTRETKNALADKAQALDQLADALRREKAQHQLALTARKDADRSAHHAEQSAGGARTHAAAEARNAAAARRAGQESHERLVRLTVAQGTRELEDGNLFDAALWYARAYQLDRGNAASQEIHRARLGGNSP